MDEYKYSSDMKKQINNLLLKMQAGENCIGETANELLNLFSVSGSYSKEDMEQAFDKGGDWRMACKNLSEGKITKFEWSESYDDFEEFISNYR